MRVRITYCQLGRWQYAEREADVRKRDQDISKRCAAQSALQEWWEDLEADDQEWAEYWKWETGDAYEDRWWRNWEQRLARK